ncbi:ORF6N domain-containing protein [Moellerella wisconsensis]|nr:ORF6N domain-containing protein [Moellerella wisconsensis]UNH43316.1 ORF6N domain-containing protein [Moellerella wisconsensis]
MNNVAKICDIGNSVQALQEIIHDGVLVVTSETLAQLYGTQVNNIKVNYSRNANRFIEGKHYFKVVGNALKNLRGTLSNLQISPMTRSLILWTERGAARHAKMIETDKAWDVFEVMEDYYFNRVTTSNYHYPIESADVHNRKFENAWLTPSSLIDNKNPAPELDLIEQLERDGFDVTGAKVRIHALHNSAKQAVQIEELFMDTKKMLHRLKDNFDIGSRLGGANVVFEGKDKGVMISGNKKRNIGCH